MMQADDNVIVTEDSLRVIFDEVGGMALEQAMLTAEVMAAIEAHEKAKSSGDPLAEIEASRVLMELIGRLTTPKRNVILQNRDRSTPAMIAQMSQIAAGPDYYRVAPTREFASGTPIVFANDDALPSPIALGRKDKAVAADGRRFPVQYAVVGADAILTSNKADGTALAEYETGVPGKLRAIAGNGRLAGIVASFDRGTAGDYVRELAEDDMHGIAADEIAQFERPVLVRIMSQADVTENIGDISNQKGTSDLSPVEQAQNDSKRIDLTALDIADDGRPTEAAVLAFIAAMPEAERNNLMDGKQASQKAYDRLMASAFWKAYNDAELVRLYAQSVDPEVKTILGGMASAAGELAKLEGAGELDIRSVVTEAAMLAVNAKRQGVKLSQFAKQVDMTLSPEVMAVVAMFAENIRSAKKIGERLRAVARFAYEEFTKEDTDMFGAVLKATREQVLDQLNKLPADDTQVSMFDAIDPLLELELSGKLVEKTAALQAAGEDDPLATVQLSGEILDIIRQLNEETPDAPAVPELKEKFPGYPYQDMTAPVVLYRSVSPAELEHILKTGSIKGGGNRFNPWDSRREVFFSDKLNAQTIYQGEEVTRRVENAMQDHPLQALYAEANAKVRELREKRNDESSATKRMALDKAIKNAEATASQIEKDFRAEMDKALAAERAANATREFTSAVIETKPLAGGRHYSKQFGKAGMGDDDEYGFDPDQVKLSDITRIHLVKNREVVKVVTPAELMAADAPAETPAPAPVEAPAAEAAPAPANALPAGVYASFEDFEKDYLGTGMHVTAAFAAAMAGMGRDAAGHGKTLGQILDAMKPAFDRGWQLDKEMSDPGFARTYRNAYDDAKYVVADKIKRLNEDFPKLNILTKIKGMPALALIHDLATSPAHYMPDEQRLKNIIEDSAPYGKIKAPKAPKEAFVDPVNVPAAAPVEAPAAPAEDAAKLAEKRQTLQDFLKTSPDSKNADIWRAEIERINGIIGAPIAEGKQSNKKERLIAKPDDPDYMQAIYDLRHEWDTRDILATDAKKTGAFKTRLRALAKKVPMSDEKAVFYIDSLTTAIFGSEYDPKVADIEFAPASAPVEAPAAEEKHATEEEAEDAMQVLRPFMSRSQRTAIMQAMNGEEAQFFYDKMVHWAEVVKTMHKSYQQDGKGMNATVHLHYFKGGSDWYITEKDREGRGTEQAFGYAIINRDRQNAELGYISIDELVQNNVELDLYWEPKTLAQIHAKDNGDEEPTTQANSEQFGNYWRYIETTQAEGATVPEGMIDQIRMDERLNDGEAETLIAMIEKPRAVDKTSEQQASDQLARAIFDPVDNEAWTLNPEVVKAMSEKDFNSIISDLTANNMHSEVLAMRAARTGNDAWHREALAIVDDHMRAGHLTPELKARTEALGAKIQFATDPDKATLPLSSETMIAGAAEMGAAAFAAGLPSTPSMNPAFRTFTKGLTIGSDTWNEVHDAYGKAWHAANAAAPVPGVTDQPTSNNPDMETLIKIAADDISKLHRANVYRVLNEAGNLRESLATYIIENRPDLQDEVLEVMAEEWPELGYSAPAAPAGATPTPIPAPDPREALITPAPVNPQRAADLAYFGDVIAEKVDMWDDSLADRLEAMIGNYAGDAEMEAKWKEAVAAYTNFMVKAMQS